MAVKTETKTIDDKEFSVTQWPAERAILTKMRLIKAIGPAIASLIKLEDGKEDDALANGLNLLFENSTPEEILTLIKTCIVGISCDGTRISESRFTELFSGDNLLTVYKVFVFVLQVNYKNFLKGQSLSGILTAVTDKTQKKI